MFKLVLRLCHAAKSMSVLILLDNEFVNIGKEKQPLIPSDYNNSGAIYLFLALSYVFKLTTPITRYRPNESIQRVTSFCASLMDPSTLGYSHS